MISTPPEGPNTVRSHRLPSPRQPQRRASPWARRSVAALLALLVASAALAACSRGAGAPKHREAAPERDRACTDPERPRAYFYPAENRTDYAPDDPWKDGCAMLVPDHLFCCPEKAAEKPR
ncbi:hypothetical protein [Sorangium cellulosum]|uniref:hypothetical protein n=1 Tax=Sorangium cellulosum TaxID=56 RepID=UPI0011DCE23E|nr:hypothetical protein [Sorangium cellulosum]